MKKWKLCKAAWKSFMQTVKFAWLVRATDRLKLPR